MWKLHRILDNSTLSTPYFHVVIAPKFENTGKFFLCVCMCMFPRFMDFYNKILHITLCYILYSVHFIILRYTFWMIWHHRHRHHQHRITRFRVVRKWFTLNNGISLRSLCLTPMQNNKKREKKMCAYTMYKVEYKVYIYVYCIVCAPLNDHMKWVIVRWRDDGDK